MKSEHPFNTRFPTILPKRHNFVDDLIRKVNFEVGHFGWSYVLAKLQKRFWVIRREVSGAQLLKKLCVLSTSQCEV